MRSIKVTYDIWHILNDESPIHNILNQIIKRGFVKVVSYQNNPRFECIFIDKSGLKIYCEIINLDFWDLIFDICNLCITSNVAEIETYGESISDINDVHCQVEADEEILTYILPTEIKEKFITNINEDLVSEALTFGSYFKNHIKLDNNRVLFSLIIDNNYPNKHQLLSIKVFQGNHPNLNITLT